MRLPGCRKRTHSAAMEAAQGCNYAGAPGGDARKFEGTLDSLGTAVAEKDTAESLRRETRKAFKETRAYVVINDFRTGDEAQGLRCKSTSNFWSPVPYAGYTVTGGAVEIFAPLVIP